MALVVFDLRVKEPTADEKYVLGFNVIGPLLF
jgi:hypothetical protein